MLNRNGSAAARAAGYSEKTAPQIAHELLRDPYVQARIKTRGKELSDYVELTAKEVIESMARAIRFDPRRMFNEDGTIKNIHELGDEVALELESVEIDEISVLGKSGAAQVKTRTSKIKFPKKSAARDQAMRFFGLNAKDKGGFDPDDGLDPPAAVAVTIDFKDARRKK